MEKYGVLQEPSCIETRTCPRCGKPNARVETTTIICPDCGARGGFLRGSDLPSSWEVHHGKEANPKANNQEGKG